MASFSMMAQVIIVGALCVELVTSQPSIDGGRSSLPGMKQDMFDDVSRAKKAGGRMPNKGPPDCPKSDGMTPFFNMAFTLGELYVRLDSADGLCHRVVSVGQAANFSELQNASRTCGPAGEWKKRIAEEMSAVFFQGGWEWPKSDNDTIEVVVEIDGENVTSQVAVSEAKYAAMMECWSRSCGCEQAANPKGKVVLFSLLLCALAGLSYDSVKVALDHFRGKKPDKHVMCKNGHRMQEVNFESRHICDICRKSGTQYQCTASCNYDMCKICYKAAKKKAKADWKAYLEKHPEDPDNKKNKKDKDDSDDDTKKEKEEDSQSEAGKETKDESASEAEKDGKSTASEAEKDGKSTPPTTGDDETETDK